MFEKINKTYSLEINTLVSIKPDAGADDLTENHPGRSERVKEPPGGEVCRPLALHEQHADGNSRHHQRSRVRGA